MMLLFFVKGTMEKSPNTGQADGVDHPRPIRTDQFKCIIIRHISWSV